METVQHKSVVSLENEFTAVYANGDKRIFPKRRVEFVFGVDRQIPALEEAVLALKKGDEIEIHLNPEDLAGTHDKDLIMEIPKAGLKKQRLAVGKVYREIRRGCLYTFTALEIRENTVLADFNKPSAGCSVDVKIRILDVRPADAQDIQQAMDRVECASAL
jgi:FKBP-type peptidyl-prolyl cis-trans isomerase SlyD